MALKSTSEPRNGRRLRRRFRGSKIGLFAVVIVCLGAGACGSSGTDLKKGLLRVAKGADLRGYTLALSEDDAHATASFTNTASKEGVTFTGDGTVVIAYRAVYDKKSDTTTNYRDDIVRKGRSLTFVITDLGTDRVVDQQSLQIDEDEEEDDGGGTPCPLCSDAREDFELNRLPILQAEANRTCKTVHAVYKCCEFPPCPGCPLVHVPIPPIATSLLFACSVRGFKARVVGGGDTHSLAIANDGAVMAWGSNAGGQLGDGTLRPHALPRQVDGLGASSTVIAVAGGRSFSLALKSDGTVLTWGTGGDGTSFTRLTPVAMVGLGTNPRVTAIAAGAGHALARKADGTVWAWGRNQNRQLGIGDPVPPIANSSTPRQVTGALAGVNVKAIAASGTVSAALTSDGRVFTWGNNTFGQLGIGNLDQQSSPVEVQDLGSDVRAIVIGAFSVALMNDGSVFAWGTNAFGSVGDNEAPDGPRSPDGPRTSPVQVIDSGSGIVAIAGGASGSHVLALKSDRTVLAWGANSAGQIGDNSTANRFWLTAVPGLTGIEEVAVGGSHSLARKVDGTVLAWGSNGNGQLGDGTFQASPTFVDVGGLATDVQIESVSACASHSLALTTDGMVLAWGSNGSGQLGNPVPDTAFAPVRVLNLPGMFKAVACGGGGGGGGHSLALRSDGAVFAWGANTNGQLGDDTVIQRRVPVMVKDLGPGSGVIAIAAGGLSFSFALKEDGSVWAWGTNINGQLGDNTADERHIPRQVFGLGAAPPSDPDSRIVAIAAGNHGLALRKNGAVLAWGSNSSGQLGIGTQVPPVPQSLVPLQVIGGLGPGSDVVAIEASANYSLALTSLASGGRVFGWGANTSGQLGDGATTPRPTPALVATLEGKMVEAISIDRADGASSFAILADGTVLGFGSNATGQLGDGTFETRSDARQVGNFGPGSGVKEVRAGTGYVLVLKNGLVSAVGIDALGQLGNGPNPTKNQTPSPVLVMVP